MNPLRILMALINFSLWLGLAGGLVDMTRTMMLDAAEAHKPGPVRLQDINRVLFNPQKH